MNYEIITSEEGKQNPANVYIRSLESPTSRITQRHALNVIARHLLGITEQKKHGRPKKGAALGVGKDDALLFDWTKLRYEHTSAIQTWLVSKDTDYKPATARRMIAAVKGTLKAAWRMYMIPDGDYLRAVDLPRIVGESIAGRMLSPEEVAALMATCDKGGPTKAARDAAILMIMLHCTARRAEVTTIQLSDYVTDYKPGIDRLILHGKRRKDRVEFPQNSERQKMADWLKIRGSEDGPMFFTVLKSDEIVRRPLQPITVYQMVLKRMAKAGIKKASSHDLRRTSISNLLDVADAMTVAKMAGHSSTKVTQLYDKRGEERMIEAQSKLHLPFRSSDRLLEAVK